LVCGDTDELVSKNFVNLLADLEEFVNTQRPDGSPIFWSHQGVIRN